MRAARASTHPRPEVRGACRAAPAGSSPPSRARCSQPGLARVPVASGVDRVVRVVGPRSYDTRRGRRTRTRARSTRLSRDPAALEIRLGPARDAARIAAVRLARHRIGDLTEDRERRRLRERIRIALQRPASATCPTRDPLPAADRGAVEAEPVVEGRLVERRDRQASCAARCRAGRRTSGRPSEPRLARPGDASWRAGAVFCPFAR